MIINDMAIGYENATQLNAGLMSSADKTKLDGVATGATANTGTVTSVGISGTSPISASGTITNSGTLSVSHANSGVTAGTYGGSTSYPVVTVNATGHVTGVTTQTVSGGLPTVTTSDNGMYLRVVNGTWAKADDSPSGVQLIGGRIFYDNGLGGAVYAFYTAGYTEIVDTSISGLANAVWYRIVSGTATTPRWYVYDNTTHTQTIQSTSVTTTNGLASSLKWGYYGTSTGVTTDSIGSGKTNTTTVLNMGVPTDKTPNIWAYIKYCRDNSLNGCSDWFIASKAEQDQLRSSGLVSWYSSNNIWSSVEYDSSNAYRWDYDNSTWRGNGSKDNTRCAFAARAF